MHDTAIKVSHVSKLYRIGASSAKPTPRFTERLREKLIAPFTNAGPRAYGHPDEFLWALKDVSFEINTGDVVGLLGLNGSGKSTMLKILSRITTPTEGRVELLGRMGSLLEVGTGFHPELTGRENIYMNALILGMTRAEVDANLDAIVDFSEIEKFIDTPVKHYSSGMYVRLAFSVAVHLKPDILILDEVLSVGDMNFRAKSMNKMREIVRDGRTVVFVSHSMDQIRDICTRGIVLSKGQLVYDGDLESAITHYMGPKPPKPVPA